MFGLFYSIVLSLFKGTWQEIGTTSALSTVANAIGKLWQAICAPFVYATPHTEGLTDVNDIERILSGASSNAGSTMSSAFSSDNVLKIVAFIIALVICIGIILVVIKAIKSIFTVFFYGLR